MRADRADMEMADRDSESLAHRGGERLGGLEFGRVEIDVGVEIADGLRLLLVVLKLGIGRRGSRSNMFVPASCTARQTGYINPIQILTAPPHLAVRPGSFPSSPGHEPIPRSGSNGW